MILCKQCVNKNCTLMNVLFCGSSKQKESMKINFYSRNENHSTLLKKISLSTALLICYHNIWMLFWQKSKNADQVKSRQSWSGNRQEARLSLLNRKRGKRMMGYLRSWKVPLNGRRWKSRTPALHRKPLSSLGHLMYVELSILFHLRDTCYFAVNYVL